MNRWHLGLPHLSCLTCFDRILHYKKRGWKQLVRKKKLVVIADSVNPHGVVMPKNYRAYFLLIKWTATKNGKPIWVDKVKNRILKPIFSICEFIAQL